MITKFCKFILLENTQSDISSEYQNTSDMLKSNASAKEIIDFWYNHYTDLEKLLDLSAKYKRLDIIDYAIDKLEYNNEMSNLKLFDLIIIVYKYNGIEGLKLFTKHFEAQSILDSAVKFDEQWKMVLDLYDMKNTDIKSQNLHNHEIIEYAMGWNNDTDEMGISHSPLNVGKLLSKFGDNTDSDLKINITDDTFRRIEESADVYGVGVDDFMNQLFQQFDVYLSTKDEMYVAEFFSNCDISIVSKYTPQFFKDKYGWLFDFNYYTKAMSK